MLPKREAALEKGQRGFHHIRMEAETIGPMRKGQRELHFYAPPTSSLGSKVKQKANQNCELTNLSHCLAENPLSISIVCLVFIQHSKIKKYRSLLTYTLCCRACPPF